MMKAMKLMAAPFVRVPYPSPPTIEVPEVASERVDKRGKSALSLNARWVPADCVRAIAQTAGSRRRMAGSGSETTVARGAAAGSCRSVPGCDTARAP